MKRGFENADRYSWSQTARVLYQMLQDIVQEINVLLVGF
jgi:hypothetical protein